jgi:class 3 adenylate cyclase/tetratricopeptide (TPR) repeat protein
VTTSAEWVEATCCFTDIQGSTQLLRDLGPARYQRVVNEHFDVLRQALRRHGGDEFGTSGDGMFMAFSEPEEAVAACLEAQRSFVAIDLGGGTALRVRMGLHTGPAVPDAAGGFVGLTVHEAARIMSAAHGGQVLLSARTASLVPSATTWTLGTFLLKDVEEPMELHQLRHDDLQSNFPPVRARSALNRSFPEELVTELFVGRSLELESLREAWHTSQTGRMGAALVGGEAGIGKTALVGRLATDVYGEGATVLYGRSRKGLTVPYQSFADALSRWTARASDDDLGEIVNRWGSYLSGLLPDLVTRFGVKPLPPVSEPGLHRFHQLQGLSALLSAVASTAPMLLVLDDMQWADASSVQLLNELTHRGSALPALIVVLYRDTDMEPNSPFKAALSALQQTPDVRRIIVGALGTDDVAQLIVEDGDDARSLHRLTGGNPFLLRQMLATGDADVTDRPHLVGNLVAARTASLGPQARSALAAACVVGSEIGLDVLAFVTGYTVGELLEVLEECAGAQLIEETGPGRFRFMHDLIWETLYSELSASRIAYYHGLIGDALEREPASDSKLPALAYHYSRALDADRKLKGIDYALTAGARAWQRLAFEAAIQELDAALATLDDMTYDNVSLRMDLLFERGRAGAAAGAAYWERGITDLWTVVNLAEEAGDVLRATRAVIELSVATVTASGDARLLEQQLRCLARLEGTPEEATQRSLLLAARGLYLAHAAGQATEGRRLSGEALQLARQLDDPIVLRHALGSHLGACIGEPIPERWAWTAEFLQLAESTGSRVDGVIAHRHYVALAAEAGDAETLRAEVSNCDELRFEAFQALAFDHLEVAENLAVKGIEEARLGEAAGQLGVVLWWRDRLDVSIASYEALLQAQPALDAPRAALALVLAASGHRTRAVSALRPLAPDGVLRLRDDTYTNSVLAVMTEAVFALDDPVLAEQLRAQMTPLAGRLITMRYIATLGAADRYLAMHHALLGRFDIAFDAFDRALDLELRFGSTTLASQTRLAYAQALARAGQTAEAASQADAARRAAEETGVDFVIRRASELGSTLGRSR